MAAYMRKAADPPNPSQYGIHMSPFDTTISPSFDTKTDINIERYTLKINEMILYAYLLNIYVYFFLFQHH
ncbi:hypothetical protein T11_14850 [Trichinella zimbabwensis]|uniref:Uncharacterized protein n=1 Tax=Trichinella zimbabwensis TaxID=268475 RepID=A0A0V1HSV9_9BILA|nr:hypothetical protein T11_14850 [Trichinella zimbabwensis]